MTDIVLSYGDVVIRQNDYDLLEPGNWLNDTIIEFFYEWLEKHIEGTKEKSVSKRFGFLRPAIVHLLAHSSDAGFLESVLEGLELKTKDVIFIPGEELFWTNDAMIIKTDRPVNDNETEQAGGGHWSLLVYYRPANAFYYYDSMGKYNLAVAKRTKTRLENLVAVQGNSRKTLSLGSIFAEIDTPSQINVRGSMMETLSQRKEDHQHQGNMAAANAKTSYDRKKRSKRYNLKLANEHRTEFYEPYHDYLNSLLDGIPEKTPANTTELSSKLVSSLHSAPKGTDWTIWLTLECRTKFLEKKAIYAPGATHSEFVEFLLTFKREKLKADTAVAAEGAAGSSGGAAPPVDNSSASNPTFGIADILSRPVPPPINTTIPIPTPAPQLQPQLPPRVIPLIPATNLNIIPNPVNANLHSRKRSFDFNISQITAMHQQIHQSQPSVPNHPIPVQSSTPLSNINMNSTYAGSSNNGSGSHAVTNPVNADAASERSNKRQKKAEPAYCYLHGVCHDHDEEGDINM
ncbi:SUMO1 sentrin specific peptidase 8 [Phlyctochytrium planicorne]|nr:SUMO1 sentrin specific peptidase 8 [Phlyctochytrium planicorne]